MLSVRFSHPGDAIYVAQCVAHLKGMELLTIIKATTYNMKQVYNFAGNNESQIDIVTLHIPKDSRVLTHTQSISRYCDPKQSLYLVTLMDTLYLGSAFKELSLKNFHTILFRCRDTS